MTSHNLTSDSIFGYEVISVWPWPLFDV